VTYRLIVTGPAKADIRSAARWYSGQRPGLGRVFVRQIDHLFDRIRANPQQYQAVYRDVRRAIARRFPYGAMYRVDGLDVTVLAVVDLHRAPAIWQGRTSETEE
jgi:plasmid stabilization system protein ParE